MCTGHARTQYAVIERLFESCMAFAEARNYSEKRTNMVYIIITGTHNEKERGRERSTKRPRSRLKIFFLTVVDCEEDDKQLLSLQRKGLIENFEKQDYNLVVETAIERLHGGFVGTSWLRRTSV